jgi:hypothetical protein
LFKTATRIRKSNKQVCDESRTRDRNETGSSLDTNNIASEDRALVIARIDREEVLNDGTGDHRMSILSGIVGRANRIRKSNKSYLQMRLD